jgi:hypothetical protein
MKPAEIEKESAGSAPTFGWLISQEEKHARGRSASAAATDAVMLWQHSDPRLSQTDRVPHEYREGRAAHALKREKGGLFYEALKRCNRSMKLAASGDGAIDSL